jgi:hypothetical protein
MPKSLSPAARSNLKDLAICLALGSLGFLQRWYDLEQTHTRASNYFREAPADQTVLISTLIASTLLGLVYWLLWLSVRRWGGKTLRTLAQCGFSLILILCLEPARHQAAHEGVPWIGHILAAIEIALLAGLVMTVLGRPIVLRAARGVTYAAFFVMPGILIDFVWFHPGSEPASDFMPEPPQPILGPRLTFSNKPAPRFIWIIFDEFDQRLAFDARPDSVFLPELDRLRSESVVANHALQAGEMTDLSIPALLTGQALESSKVVGAKMMVVRPSSSSAWIDLHDRSNLFQRVRDLGVNAAVAGWHFPYCRLFGDQVVRCLATSGGVPDALRPESQASEFGIFKTVAFLFQLRWGALLDVFDNGAREERVLESSAQHKQLDQYLMIRKRALADAVDPQIGLLYLHFPAPHLFAIYDRKHGDFSLSDATSYLDNLALVDRTVGELRRTLERADLWDSTNLLISGDHGLRPWLWRDGYNWTPEMDRLTAGGVSTTVPFILKLAGQRKGAMYNQPFSTLLSGDLAVAVLNGRVSNEGQASVWLDHRGPEGSSSAQ